MDSIIRPREINRILTAKSRGDGELFRSLNVVRVLPALVDGAPVVGYREDEISSRCREDRNRNRGRSWTDREFAGERSDGVARERNVEAVEYFIVLGQIKSGRRNTGGRRLI